MCWVLAAGAAGWSLQGAARAALCHTLMVPASPSDPLVGIAKACSQGGGSMGKMCLRTENSSRKRKQRRKTRGKAEPRKKNY